MAQKGNVALDSEITNNVINMSNLESIDQTDIGGLLLDLADSSYNIVDSLAAITSGMTMAEVAAAIIGGTLIPLSWILISDRPGAVPLYIQAMTQTTISPIGIQLNAGVPCMVIMDYLNGYEGNTQPFIASFDSTHKLSLLKGAGQANGSIGTILQASASLTFGTVAAGTNSDQTIACVGAAVGDPVRLGADVGTMGAGAYICTAFVSSPGVVTVRFVNASSGPVTPAVGIFKITIIK